MVSGPRVLAHPLTALGFCVEPFMPAIRALCLLKLDVSCAGLPRTRSEMIPKATSHDSDPENQLNGVDDTT